MPAGDCTIAGLFAVADKIWLNEQLIDNDTTELITYFVIRYPAT